jgi:hypothetical protein
MSEAEKIVTTTSTGWPNSHVRNCVCEECMAYMASLMTGEEWYNKFLAEIRSVDEIMDFGREIPRETVEIMAKKAAGVK